LEPKLGGVDTGEVACAAGLVLLWAKGKAVNGDRIGNTGGTETSVVVPDLVAGEVFKNSPKVIKTTIYTKDEEFIEVSVDKCSFVKLLED
jgi:hypothetical protein